MSVNYEVYILSKTDMLSILLRSFAEDSHTLFISEIDKWDWEVENTIEGFAQLYEGIVLAKDAERRVTLRSKTSDLAVSLKILIETWNTLIELASVTYSHYSEDVKREISEHDIDFNLYFKTIGG